MKTLFVLAAVLLSGILVQAQTVPLQVSFKFINVEEGYDHDCKTEVLIDGVSAGETDVVKESQGGKFTVDVPVGVHDIRVVNWAYYEGNWEEHTIENNYSLDCVWSETGHDFKKASKLFFVYDLDSETIVSWKKAPKIK